MVMGYHEGAAFGLFVLFAIIVVLMTSASLLPVLVWYLLISVAIVTILVMVYRCVKRNVPSTSNRDRDSISIISDGRGNVMSDLKSTGKTLKKDLPPNYAVATSADLPPPTYAAIVHTFKTPPITKTK